MTATPKVDRFKEFMKSYMAFKSYSESAKGVYSKDVGERLKAREDALDYASSNLGLAATLKDPTVREAVQNQVIDKYFNAAISQFGAEASYTMTTSGREVIEDAPDKGLVKIVLGTQPCEIEGNDVHNKAAVAHSKYWHMNQVIDMYKKDSDDDVVLEKHKQALGVTLKYAQLELAASAQSNPALKDNGEVVTIMFDAIRATLATSPNANITFAGDARNRAKEEFDGLTTTESAKAGYARETLIHWLENDKKNGKAYVAEQLGKMFD